MDHRRGRTRRWVAAALGSLALLAPPARSQVSPPEVDDPRVAETARFRFWSDVRVNLHHFLYQWANSRLSDDGLHPIRVAERDSLEALTDEEREIWLDAVAFYEEHLAARSLVFDDGMTALRDELAGLRGVGPVGALRGELAEAVGVVARAEPVYRAHWWLRHDTANRAWIGAVLPVLRSAEQDLGPRLAVALDGRWPEDPIRVDAAAYSGRVGAYTADGPHITISSLDPGYGMPRSLEMLFHEASHISSLEGPLRTAVEEAFRAQGLRAPPGFSHVVIFETAGVLAARAWSTRGNRAYVTYADHVGLYERNGTWAAYRAAVAPYWGEYLRGSLEQRDALSSAARALAAAR